MAEISGSQCAGAVAVNLAVDGASGLLPIHDTEAASAAIAARCAAVNFETKCLITASA